MNPTPYVDITEETIEFDSDLEFEDGDSPNIENEHSKINELKDNHDHDSEDGKNMSCHQPDNSTSSTSGTGPVLDKSTSQLLPPKKEIKEACLLQEKQKDYRIRNQRPVLFYNM